MLVTISALARGIAMTSFDVLVEAISITCRKGADVTMEMFGFSLTFLFVV